MKINTIDIFWGVIFYITLFSYQQYASYIHDIFHNLIICLIDCIVLLFAAIIINHILIPKYLYAKKNVLFFTYLFITLVASVFALQYFQWLWYINNKLLTQGFFDFSSNLFYQIFNSYFVVLMACTLAISRKLFSDQINIRNRYLLLEKINAQTELSFLKAQINPHFLFNSINSIFANIDKNNRTAREIVIKFSDMLRYQLYECNVEQISFEKELAYLNNYVDVQKTRKDENLIITIDHKGEMYGFTIAPLILIPFIENAFKYSSNNTDKKNILQIVFTKTENEFYFYCINTKDQIMSRKILEDGGIGIQNVKRRLELIYPDRHELIINDNEIFFEVTLKIKLL